MLLPPPRPSVAVVLLAASWLAACGGPDARSDGEVPEAVVTALSPDSLRSTDVAPGVRYHFLWSPRGPFALHLAEIDLSRCELGLDVATARPDPGAQGGHEAVSAMAARHPRSTLVAVNGDFFTPEGRPLGPEVSRGEVGHGRSRPALAWRDGGEVWIGTSGVDDGVVGGPGWSVGEGALEIDVLGGFPELLDGGRRVDDLGVASNPSFAASRHPRTAVGFDPAGQRLWIVVVDGRQGAYSTGMSLPELAEVFEALGVTEALNLDGGGSSIMLVEGRAVSRPSDAAGERPVVNALLLVRDASLCR